MSSYPKRVIWDPFDEQAPAIVRDVDGGLYEWKINKCPVAGEYAMVLFKIEKPNE